MDEVLRHAGLRAPAPLDDAYTLYFDGEPDVHVLSSAQGRIDVLCEAGRLGPARDAGLLLELLALNHLAPDPYAVMVGADRASGTVLVWASQPLASLDADALRRLLQCVRQRGAAVLRLLGRSGISHGGHAASARARLQQLLR